MQQGFDHRTPRRAWSLNDANLSDPLPSNSGHRWSTTGDLQSTDMNQKRIKSVAFSIRVNVVLIPTILEYENAGLTDQLWWNEDDYRVFKVEALEELRHFMYVNRIRDQKLATHKLYAVNENLDAIVVKVNEQELSQEVHADAHVLFCSQSSIVLPVDTADNDGTAIDEKESSPIIDATSVVDPFCITVLPPFQREDGEPAGISKSNALMELKLPASMPFSSPLSNKHHKHIRKDHDTTLNARQSLTITGSTLVPDSYGLSLHGSMDWVI